MDYWAILLQPGVWLALAGFAVLLSFSFWLAEKLDDRLNGIPVAHALHVSIGKPLFRVVPMLLFLTCAFPLLLGLSTPATGFDLSALMNSLFLLSLILPQLPGLSRLHGPVLLLQLMLACALLFHWHLQALSAPESAYHLLPTPGLSIAILGLSVGVHLLTDWLSHHIGSWVTQRHHRLHAEVITQEGLAVLLQGPVLILYSSYLGQQLAPAG